MANDDDRRFLDDFTDRWERAWNSHDTEEVVALTHPEIEWDDRTFWPDVVHGHDGLRRYVDEIWRAMPDVRFEGLDRFYAGDGRRGVYLFRQFGSAPQRLAPGRFDSHGCDVFLAFRGDRLSHYLASYDIARMLVQMGALPPREGKLGGAHLVSLARRGQPTSA